MEEKLSYKKCGDYLIPDIKLSFNSTTLLGKYGRLRREYLKKFASFSYNDMILNEELFPHLYEIDETAKKRMEILMEQLLEKNPAPDKKTQQMSWQQHMNSLKAQAEENVMAEIVYC